jgi:hypothetical protein
MASNNDTNSNETVKDKAGDASMTNITAKKTLGPPKALRKAVLEKNPNGDQIILPDTIGGTIVNDLNKDTNPKVEPKENNTGTRNEKSYEDVKSFRRELTIPTLTTDDAPAMPSLDSTIDGKVDDTEDMPKEGVQRSDSFRRAMGEGLFGSEKDMNMKKSGVNTGSKEHKRSFSSTSSTSSSSLSKNGSSDEKVTDPSTHNEQPQTVETKSDSEKDNVVVKEVNNKDDECLKENSVTVPIQPKFLKVTSDGHFYSSFLTT